jgi:hypothetical protein
MTNEEKLADLKARRGIDNLGDQLRNERRISELLERMLAAAVARTCGTCRHWVRDVSDADYGRCWLIESLATVEHANHSCPKWAAKDSAKRG